MQHSTNYSSSVMKLCTFQLEISHCLLSLIPQKSPLSDSMDLTTVKYSLWDLAAFILLSLAYSFQNGIFKIPVWCCVLQDNLLFFKDQVIVLLYLQHYPLCIDTPVDTRLFLHLGYCEQHSIKYSGSNISLRF